MADLVRYVDTASSGGDGTTQAHSGTNAAYASLAAWEAAEQADLTSTPDTMTVYCAGTQDSTALIILSWTTASGADITIAGDPSAPDGDGKNNGSTFSTSYYYHDIGNGIGVSLREDFITFDGVQFQCSATSAGSHNIDTTTAPGAGAEITVQNCRFKMTGTANGTSAINLDDSDPTYNVINCTVEWTNGTNRIGIRVDATTAANVYNCTVEGGAIGIEVEAGNATIKNCCLFNNDDDISDVDAGSTISYCATDDGDGTNGQDMSPGGTESDGWNAAVTDYANGDYTIKDDSSVLLDNGDATGAPSTDINGTSWGTHDIGAFARTAAAGQTVGTGLTSGLKLQRPKLVA